MEISDAMLASALIRVKSYDISAIPDDSQIDHVFSTDFERKMNKLISSFGKKERSITFFKNTLSKAAVIILTLCIGAFSLIMISPQARADFRNAVMEFYETHIKFYFVSGDETASDFKSYENVCADYVPQGFDLKETYSEYEAIGYKYEKTDGELSYDVYVSLNDGLSVLTDENKENVQEIRISEKDAYLISGENEGNPYSTLIIAGNKITVIVYGQLTEEEIIKIGESVKEKQGS